MICKRDKSKNANKSDAKRKSSKKAIAVQVQAVTHLMRKNFVKKSAKNVKPEF